MLDEKPRSSARSAATLVRILAILVVVAVLVLSFMITNLSLNQKGLMALGLFGVFAVTAISAASVGVPVAFVPAVVVLNAAYAYNPIVTSFVAGLGATCGEFSGYLVGRSGSVLVGEESRHYRSVARLMQRSGALTIVALAWVPNPLFDVVGIVAGLSRYPPAKFAIYCCAGKTAKWLTLILMTQIVSQLPFGIR